MTPELIEAFGQNVLFPIMWIGFFIFVIWRITR